MEINDWPDYLIYPNGDVWSKDRVVEYRDGSRIRKFPGVKLRGYLSSHNGKKYLIYDLYKHCQRSKISAHRLVAIHYLANPYNLPAVNHINGDTLDNNVGNLEWCTIAYNNQSINKHPTKKRGFGCIQPTLNGTYMARYNDYKVRHQKNFPTLEEAEQFLRDAEERLKNEKRK